MAQDDVGGHYRSRTKGNKKPADRTVGGRKGDTGMPLTSSQGLEASHGAGDQGKRESLSECVAHAVNETGVGIGEHRARLLLLVAGRVARPVCSQISWNW